jgi:hypothetical protein
MKLLAVDPECLSQYGIRAHMIGDDVLMETPEVVAHPEQATAAVVTELHAQVEWHSVALSTVAHEWGAQAQAAALNYLTTEEDNESEVGSVAS